MEVCELAVRSLIRAPLGRSVKRGAGRSDPKAPDVEIRINHCTIAFGERVRPRANPLLSAGEVSPRTSSRRPKSKARNGKLFVVGFLILRLRGRRKDHLWT